MALNGEASQPPLKFGIAAADMFTGMYSARLFWRYSSSVNELARDTTSKWRWFDCGLMITCIADGSVNSLAENCVTETRILQSYLTVWSMLWTGCSSSRSAT